MKKIAKDKGRKNIPRFNTIRGWVFERMIFLFLFFLSGGCGLVYEVTWSRMLVTVFGGTVFSVSTVLTSIMAGLAIGSFFGGRIIDSRRDPLRIYGFLEAGIGLYAILLPFLLSLMGNLWVHIHPLLPSYGNLLTLIRFILSFFLLVIPTTLMGATFPVMSRFFVRRIMKLGGGVAGLYSANTFGAVVGSFLTGFFLLGAIGVRWSIYTSAGINLLIAGVVLALSMRPALHQKEMRDEKAEERGGVTTEAVIYPRGILVLVLVTFALSGFSALSYEVLWTRVLSFFLQNNTSYAFTTMLVTFLLGIALGSLIFGKITDRLRNPLLLFGLLEIMIGLLTPLSIFMLGNLSSIIERAGQIIPFPTFWGYSLLRFASCFLVMFLPTILMGATFPLVSKIYIKSMKRLGRGIGSVYSVNTIGSIFGSFSAGFILIPLLGTERSILTMALLNLSIGGVLVFFNPQLRSLKRGVILSGTVLIGILLSFLFPRDIFSGILNRSVPGSRLLYHKEGITGTVTVHEEMGASLLLSINGVPEVPLDYQSFQTFRMLGHLPLLLHPDPERVLTIAFGGGIALGAVVQHPVQEVDCVEICPEVIKASSYFTEVNHRVLESPKIKLVIDDGRNYVLTTSKVYDVITGDATHPRSSDSWVLYTKEFYETCKKRLAPGGIMCQWLPLHGLAEEDYKTILKTFKSTFPHTTLWFTNNFTIMVGTPERLLVNFSILKERMREERVNLSLKEVNLDDPFAFLSTFILDESAIDQYVGDVGTNSDDHPKIVTAESRAFGRNTVIENIWGISSLRKDILPFLTNLGEEEGEVLAVKAKIEKYFESRKHSISARVFWVGGILGRALSEYEEALSINPEDKDSQYLHREVSELYNLGETELKRRAELYPRDPVSHSILGYSYMERGSLDEAIDELKKALEIEPNLGGVRVLLGEIYLSKGMVDLAIQELKRAILIEPGRAIGHLRLGDAYLRKGLRDLAISEYEKAIRIDPKSARVFLSLGYAYQEGGDEEKAIEAYTKSIELTPTPHAHDNLGTVYANRGEMEKAMKEWESALRIDPDYAPAREHMERARKMLEGG